MAEFKKDSELTLYEAPFKRCIASAKFKVEGVKTRNPELSDMVDKVLMDLAKVEIDWKPIGRQLHTKLAKKDSEE